MLSCIEGIVNDEKLPYESVEEDGLVVVRVGRSKLVVRTQLESDHQAFHLRGDLESKSSVWFG